MTVDANQNWFQRRYFAWAEPHYRRMPSRTRAEVERIDRWLYSRHGAGVWFILLLALVAIVLAFKAIGLPLLPSVVAGVGVLATVTYVVLGAWLQPERFVGRKGVRVVILMTLGAAAGFLVGRIFRDGGLTLATLWPAAQNAVAESLPMLALAVLLLGLTLELTARARRRLLSAELEQARLIGERDAAARDAAEAQLRLLQGQIRPHFIFNTLASLQHWVDTGDSRAGPLLRSLTALLRASTAAMDAPLATIDAECETARHYLAVAHARFGERLRSRVDLTPECAQVELPAGLVLTLVENAVGHGIEPSLAGGSIEVLAAREGGAVVLRVRDDGVGLQGLALDVVGRGVGLANSRARLAHRYGEAATLELEPGPGGRGAEARVQIAV